MTVETKERAQGREGRTEHSCQSAGRVSPLYRCSRSLNFQSRPVTLSLSPTAMAQARDRKPVCIIAIGMAGSGKSTFVQRLNAHLHALSPPAPPYVVNLDPAVTNLSYEPNIDIRDTVDYHQVMRQCAVAVAVPLCTLR